MTKPIPKKELMRRLRERRKADGFVKCVAYILPENRWRHKRYVEGVLKGEIGSG